jgi:hypothetical protein
VLCSVLKGSRHARVLISHQPPQSYQPAWASVDQRGTGTALDGMGSTTAGSATGMWAVNGSTSNPALPTPDKGGASEA